MFGIFANLHTGSSSPIQIFGRAGLVLVEYDLDIFVDIPGVISGPTNVSYYDTGIAFGVGASFDMSDKLAIVAEYSILPDVDFEGIDIETDTLGVGILMSF